MTVVVFPPPVSEWLHGSLVDFVKDAAREAERDHEHELAAEAWKLLTRLVDAGRDLDVDLRHDLGLWLRCHRDWGVLNARPVVAGDAETLLVLLGAS